MAPTDFFFLNDSETAKIALHKDWSHTGLGRPDSWPHELKIILGMLFSNKQPVALFWGPDKNFFYNDSYIPIVGASKHPHSLGEKGEVVWGEIWNVLLPQINQVVNEREATWNVDQHLPVFGDDGQLREAFFTYSYSPVFLATGSVGGTLVTCTETTEKVLANKKIEEANLKLEESRKVLYDFFMQSPVPMVIMTGTNFHFTLANPPYEKLIGRKSMGLDLLEIYTSAEAGMFIPLLQGVYTTGVPYIGKELPLTISDENGLPKTLWIDLGYHPFRDDLGNIQGVLAIVIDVTEHRSTRVAVEVEKQKFEAIFFESPSAMALLQGPTFIYEKVNPSYEKLMNSRALIGLTRKEAMPELQDRKLNNILEDVFRTGLPYIGKEVPVMLRIEKEGQLQEVIFDITYSRVEDGEGNPYGIFIHATDVTDKVYARQKILEAVRMRDEFLSIASHELKTPITSLKLQLQMLRRGINLETGQLPAPDKMARAIDISAIQVSRLTNLIEDLLDVTRLESGKMVYQFKSTDLSAVVHEVMERFPEYGMLNLIDENLEENATVMCDRFRIEQVFTNLLNNAIKYGAGKPISITVRVLKDTVCLCVKDNGLGISEDLQPKVFQRFERAISDQNISGLGLGLYISKQIVDAHQGTLKVESQLGKGSTFTVELPR